MKAVLLLAGTADARAFAAGFAFPDVRLIASLAGVTAAPLPYRCETRRGGFGGVDGLRDYLSSEGIVAVVDAMHPFAAGMSGNAVAACDMRGISLIALIRPEWEAAGDWNSHITLEAAVASLPTGARVLSTTGRKHVAPFIARADVTTFLRSVDPLEGHPPHIVPITARGPFDEKSERRLMQENGITHLLTRNAGGDSRARIDAAVAFGLPIHVVERPPHPAANVVHSVADAFRWMENVLDD